MRLKGHIAALVLICPVTTGACGGARKEAERLPRLGPLNWQGAEEKSRCAFKGRGDRDIVEAMAPGAPRPNVLRVYGYVGVGEERRRVLLCREVDTNFDGRKDILRIYGDDGAKLTEQADSDYDGKVDTWLTFGSAGLTRAEFDKNGDGRADESRIYEGGILVRSKRDSNGDGKADIFENYREGRLIRMGFDTNFDGLVDVWRRDASFMTEENAEVDEATGAKAKSQSKGGSTLAK